MNKLYGTLLCPDCLPAIEFLKSNNIDFEFLSITDNLEYLKEFLKLRDSEEIFKEIRQDGSIGIPCLIDEDNNVIFQDEIYNLK